MGKILIERTEEEKLVMGSWDYLMEL